MSDTKALELEWMAAMLETQQGILYHVANGSPNESAEMGAKRWKVVERLEAAAKAERGEKDGTT